MASKKEPLLYVRWVTPGVGTMTYMGTDYDRGQLIALQGSAHDEQLTRLGYVAPVEAKHLVAQCGVCGEEFLNEHLRTLHGRRRHRHRFGEDLEVAARMSSAAGVAAAHDVTGDAEEKQLMAEAPLYLEKTIASQK